MTTCCKVRLKALNELVDDNEQVGTLHKCRPIPHQDALTLHDLAALDLFQVVFSEGDASGHLLRFKP